MQDFTAERLSSSTGTCEDSGKHCELADLISWCQKVKCNSIPTPCQRKLEQIHPTGTTLLSRLQLRFNYTNRLPRKSSIINSTSLPPVIFSVKLNISSTTWVMGNASLAKIADLLLLTYTKSLFNSTEASKTAGLSYLAYYVIDGSTTVFHQEDNVFKEQINNLT